MGRLATLAVAGLTAATLGASAPALAAGRHTASGVHPRRVRVEVVIERARTRDGARDMVDRLADAGVRGFRIERGRNGRFEVERPFHRFGPAIRELVRLHHRGIHARLEFHR